ncbi:hypothetical protein ACFFX0_30455 [Citricoccus parietis]|uniref:Uncharacterized protein n=1 Tax=Citricoccus parietis TaxID=592307 RepID=A0ABV5G8K3_9MICC
MLPPSRLKAQRSTSPRRWLPLRRCPPLGPCSRAAVCVGCVGRVDRSCDRGGLGPRVLGALGGIL